uniref:ZZ-type domain-containing protein n=1 Tax=Chromera velia CCMP2878 TaxID=1169474 RepID=A0A0G4HQK7_9ALVE|mmetsp:Transcript_22816/g.44943  ORF Transcript_22816/g.44943 Transcript_22816/m.44943 type:complete len:180 (+) Transcript_22816:282-821(+)|eukprot:Cvel_30246.t1-p1 / transcript=Cvel_30246.t1 / gene=Cvel_30246 / organism=Chromera_velia_CCMP2878 / gene_product=hypothetical protein / transcript_product=hypothetical protein / location=Cvel_scaffold4288:3580-4116(-) / protein_length=179 / sequence_SO=supercontig / SO=protein_coding / is_pseudo=false
MEVLQRRSLAPPDYQENTPPVGSQDRSSASASASAAGSSSGAQQSTDVGRKPSISFVGPIAHDTWGWVQSTSAKFAESAQKQIDSFGFATLPESQPGAAWGPTVTERGERVVQCVCGAPMEPQSPTRNSNGSLLESVFPAGFVVCDGCGHQHIENDPLFFHCPKCNKIDLCQYCGAGHV